MAVSYSELYGWPKGKWNRGDFDGRRRLLCYWDDVLALLLELDAAPGWPWTAYPWGAADATIREAEVIPFGKSNAPLASQSADYEFAIIDCLYTTRGPKWNTDYNVFVEETLEAGFNSFAVDATDLRWESDGAQVQPNDAPINHDSTVEYIVYFSNLTSLPAWITARPGLSNAGSFATAGLGIVFSPQTLKYLGCRVRGTYSLGHLPRYDLTAKFSHKWSGWNNFWRPDGGGSWEGMVTKDGAPYIQHPPVAMNLI